MRPPRSRPSTWYAWWADRPVWQRDVIAGGVILNGLVLWFLFGSNLEILDLIAFGVILLIFAHLPDKLP